MKRLQKPITGRIVLVVQLRRPPASQASRAGDSVRRGGGLWQRRILVSKEQRTWTGEQMQPFKGGPWGDSARLPGRQSPLKSFLDTSG